jgi:hypothetical protein
VLKNSGNFIPSDMGLDSYVRHIPQEDIIDDFSYNHEHEHNEVAYWRKNYEIHQFFKERYIQRGGTDKDFNCCPIRITQADVDALKAYSRVQPERDDSIHRFIYDAQMYLDDGNALYFSSWY